MLRLRKFMGLLIIFLLTAASCKFKPNLDQEMGNNIFIDTVKPIH